MAWEAWITLGVIAGLVVALVREIARPDVIVMGALGALMVSGVVTPEQAFAGFSNPAVITIAALYVVAAGVHRTGVLASLDRWLLPDPVRLPSLLLRIMAPVAALSSFLNNTPVVAMFIPRLQDVAERTGIPASKLLMPLSFAAIAGGMTTLLGTSTNLIASGLLLEAGYPGYSIFEFAWIGVPAVLFTVVYLAFIGHRFLPNSKTRGRNGAVRDRDYQFELRVGPSSSLAGKSIADAELRALRDAYLVHIHRDGRWIGPATPDEVLYPGDVLTFSGQPAAMERLLQRTGLERTVNGLAQTGPQDELPLYEAVVSSTSNLIGRTLKQVGFREHYQGVVLAIHRQNEQIRGALGNIPLKPGDLLLVEARDGFDKRWNHGQGDFYLVAPKRRAPQPLSRKAPIALGLMVAMILLNVLGVMPLAAAAFAAALGMVVLGCLRGAELRRSVDVSVMVTIAAAFGIGQAVEASGLASFVAHGIVQVVPSLGIFAVLVALYLATQLLTEIITNSAAVVLMVPIALAAGVDVGVDPRALALCVTIAASASFLSPLGYQTNLMVMGVGGYRVKDYIRTGFPISLGVMAIALTVVYWKWVA